MTTPRQGTGGPEGRPLCWNGERHENYLVQDGWLPGYTDDGTPTQFPVMRYVPNNFSRDCKSWVADPSTDPVPLAEGWACKGCKHYPEAAVEVALANQARRNPTP